MSNTTTQTTTLSNSNHKKETKAAWLRRFFREKDEAIEEFLRFHSELKEKGVKTPYRTLMLGALTEKQIRYLADNPNEGKGVCNVRFSLTSPKGDHHQVYCQIHQDEKGEMFVWSPDVRFTAEMTENARIYGFHNVPNSVKESVKVGLLTPFAVFKTKETWEKFEQDVIEVVKACLEKEIPFMTRFAKIEREGYLCVQALVEAARQMAQDIPGNIE